MTEKRSDTGALPSMSIRVLIVDDDEPHAQAVAESLQRVDYECTVANSGERGAALIESENFDVVVTDLKMDDLDGLAILQRTKEELPDAEVILLTGHASVQSALAAGQSGASMYLTKPLDINELRGAVDKASERLRLIRRNVELSRRLDEKFGFEGVVGNSPSMNKVIEQLKHVAPTNSTVLIHGESGTGKELVARALHQNSERKSKPFVPLNISALPDSILESELFGHEIGAFTGADRKRIGKFEFANGGTLFLDEVGEIPLASQAKLLSFLEEGIFRRVGGEQDRMVKVRIITATNRDLKQMTLNGEFRADLYYRLAVVSLNIPPLRGNKRLISHMTDRFIDTLNKRRREPFILPQFVRDRLMHYHWPGNVRELVNITQQLAIFADETVDYMQLMDELMPPFSAPANSPDNELFNESILPARHLKDMVRIYEKSIIDEAINTYGSKRAAARALGVDIGTIVRKTNNEKLN